MYSLDLIQKYWTQIEEENPSQRLEKGGRNARATRKVLQQEIDILLSLENMLSYSTLLSQA